MEEKKKITTPSSKQKKEGIGKNKNWLWSIIFIFIALLSIVAIVAQSGDFSLADFMSYIKGSSKTGLIAAFLSMLCYILFEAFALLLLCRALSHKKRLWSGFIYSASDIYFSAITPSATGGQPASAYFMMKDGMDGMLATTALIVNLCMYTLSVIAIGVVCFIFGFGLFADFSILSQLLIAAGFIVQVALMVFFTMLVMREKLLHRICAGFIRFMAKIRVIKKPDEKLESLNGYMEKYRQYAVIISGHRKTLFFAFLLNFVQRLAQIAVTMFVYMATTGETFANSVKICFLQAYTILGSYCVPLPGGVGVADYLMLDGFGTMMSSDEAVHLELLSRSVSFYSCIFICGAAVLIQYCIVKRRSKNL